MPRQAPYLHRRGDILYFRIAVPADLRPHVGWREITKTLRTAERARAIPMALECAARAKRVFWELRSCMNEGDSEKLMALVRQKSLSLQLDAMTDQHKDELIDQRAQHLRELKLVKVQAENEALRGVLARFPAPPVGTRSPTPASALAAPVCAPVPTLKVVVDGFLGKYQQDKKPAMFRKHKPVLSMFLGVVGDKPINELRQADINDFFELVGRLPPQWAAECRRRKLTVQELAELDFDVTLGPKSFEDTYIASVRPFLTAAKKDWQDQGFPLGLTTDGIEYIGDREEDENKQRSFTREELGRLFEGEELHQFLADKNNQHQYWLPTIGLFTGARVNEICQLNPQTDIVQEKESGIWYFWITKETEADPRIRKSVKTSEARTVPIHHKLIEFGFLEYVERVKAGGHKLLFPEWLPINRRASGNAEKWFRQFLRDTNLRDETPKAKILGMHAFRHTLLTHGANQTPPLILTAITGHAQGDLPVPVTGAARGYFTASQLNPLSTRKELLDKLDYQIAFHKPLAA